MGQFSLRGASVGVVDADQTAGFTFTIGWGDGSPVQTVSGLSGIQVTHVFTTTATDTILVSADGEFFGRGQPNRDAAGAGGAVCARARRFQPVLDGPRVGRKQWQQFGPVRANRAHDRAR